MNFNELTIAPPFIESLAKQNITEPTPIQTLAIPPILAGHSVMVQGETGSGKTLSYLLPIFQSVKGKGNQCVILLPTKELAMQVYQVICSFSKLCSLDLSAIALIGGVNIKQQIEKLKEKPQILVGTMDRIQELILKKKIAAHLVKTIVVDEADTLVHKQNIAALKTLRKSFMKQTQMVFVSATLAPKHLEAMKEMAPTLEFIQREEAPAMPPAISHFYLVCPEKDKLYYLKRCTQVFPSQKGLIFINQLEKIEKGVKKLKEHEIPCTAIHSENTKQERQKVLLDFSQGKVPYLVATDLMARGMDIENIDVVFHVDIAENPSDYLHRAGRAGRQGKKGTSVCLVSENELHFLKKYEKQYHISFQEVTLFQDQFILR